MDSEWYGGHVRCIKQLCKQFGRWNAFTQDMFYVLDHRNADVKVLEKYGISVVNGVVVYDMKMVVKALLTGKAQVTEAKGP